MYHALVRRDGDWTSFGLHVPSNQWSTIMRTLKRAFGPQNVQYTYWDTSDYLFKVSDVEDRCNRELRSAATAQATWDAGNLSDAAEEDGSLNLARGIMLIEQRASHSV